MGMPEYPDGWHTSLLLYNRRIDGCGFERRYLDRIGHLRSGWHRHVWNPSTQNADEKVAVRLFSRKDANFRNFLIRSFKLMKIDYIPDKYYANLSLFQD